MNIQQWQAVADTLNELLRDVTEYSHMSTFQSIEKRVSDLNMAFKGNYWEIKNENNVYFTGCGRHFNKIARETYRKIKVKGIH